LRIAALPFLQNDGSFVSATRSWRLPVWLAACVCAAAVGQTNHRVDPDTGIETWEIHQQGVALSLTQILPDQARAFYINRGFAAEAVEDYATSCVYMTVLRNDSAPSSVHFRLAGWSVASDDDTHPPLSVERWLERLATFQPSKSALLAFRWAQFPPEQTYQPGGDWNQGMLTMGLAPGVRFDLIARWDVAREPLEGVVKDVRCAE